MFYFRIVLAFQENCENSTESSHIPPQPVSPIINILHYYGTFVTINEPILIYYH